MAKKSLLSPTQVEAFLQEQERMLMTARGRTAMAFTEQFRKKLPASGGVYAFFHKGRIFYVGETTLLSKRLATDMRNPENHVLTLKIARALFDDTHGVGKAGKNRIFDESHKQATRDWMARNLRVRFLSLLIGRRELEERVHKYHNPPFNKRDPKLP